MKKAAKILYLIGGIYSIITAVTLMIIGIVFVVFAGASFTSAIIEGIRSGEIRSSFSGSEAEVASQIQLMFMTIGLVFVFMASFGVVNSILSFKARNSANRKLFIANIVFSALSGVEVNLVGSIFALIVGNTLDDVPEQPKAEPAPKINLRKSDDE